MAVLILHFLVSSIQQSVGVLDLKAQLDGHLLLYAIMISATTAFLFGLVPALKLIQIDPQLSLGNQMGNRSGGSLNIRLRKGLMIFQVAVTVILVARRAVHCKSFEFTKCKPRLSSRPYL